MNRLNLDYTIDSAKDRTAFVQQYLSTINFQPNEKELNIIANYMIQGLDDNGEKNKLIQIDTVHGTWDSKKEESLEAILESENFPGEFTLHPINSIFAPKSTNKKFSREEAAKNPDMLALLEPLWSRIDRLDLLINYYEIYISKRTKPPREELLKRFSANEQNNLQQQAANLTQYEYLKCRHLLVASRQEQYYIRDQFIEQGLAPHTIDAPQSEDILINFYPLGLREDNKISTLIFKPFSELRPDQYTEKDLRLISNFYWTCANGPRDYNFDFSNIEHIYHLYLNFDEATSEQQQTLLYYQSQTELEPHQLEVLELKRRHAKNADIAVYLNKKYNKTYTENYISTIFRQKTLAKIAHTAELHKKIISNLFFKENFKKCTRCGRTYLIDNEYFVHKSHSLDGFSNRCKNCDKIDRRKKRDI